MPRGYIVMEILRENCYTIAQVYCRSRRRTRVNFLGDDFNNSAEDGTRRGFSMYRRDEVY